MCKYTGNYGLIFIVALLTAGCASNQRYHENIGSGQVVIIDGSDVIVCVGSEDGAKPGMILDVYEVEYFGSMTMGTDEYSLKDVGDIRIKSLINKHFARASIIDGKVQPNNVVKLSRE